MAKKVADSVKVVLEAAVVVVLKEAVVAVIAVRK